MQVLKERIAWLEESNEELCPELHKYRSRCSFVERCDIDETDGHTYFLKNDGLEKRFRSSELSDHLIAGSMSGEDSRESDEVEKELEHALLLNTMDKEMHELNKQLEQKETEMKLVGVDTEALIQHFGKKIMELEDKKIKVQLKKEGRRNENERHKLEALNQRQKMVLHRKTEEATMATKRLKEFNGCE